MENKNDIKDFLNDYYSGKFKNRDGQRFYHDIEKIKIDKRFYLTNEYIKNLYYNMGYGIKKITKEIDCNITNVVLRTYMIDFAGIKLRKNNEVTDWLKKFRSKKARKEFNNKIGFFSEGIQENLKTNKTRRGIQGYYFNVSMNKYVWLRSSWEYIYAKWLDKNNIKWDIEVKNYIIDKNTGESYRPDFFIYENDKITKIVEVKGYWKNRLYKFEKLKTIIEKNISFVLVDKIKPYSDNVNKDIRIWKKERKLKINYENKKN